MSPIVVECASIAVFNGTIVVPKQGVRCSARIRINVKTTPMVQNDINDHLIQKPKVKNNGKYPKDEQSAICTKSSILENTLHSKRLMISARNLLANSKVVDLISNKYIRLPVGSTTRT